MTTTALATMPQFTQNMMPTLPQEMRNVFAQMFAPAMDSFGSNFNRISLKGSRFRLIAGGQEIHTFSDQFDFVIMGISPEQHCVWYANAWNGEEGVEPDAVWAQNEQPPSNVPASALTKDANGRNQYSVRRRIVVAPFLQNQNGGTFLDLDNLFVWDVGGMSSFGEDLNLTGGQYNKAHALGNYMTWFKNTGVYPCAVPTKAIFKTAESVPVARFMPGYYNNQPAILPNEMLQRIATRAMEASTLELLDWRRGRPAAQAPQQPQQGEMASGFTQQQQQQSPVQQQTYQQPVQQTAEQQPQQQTVNNGSFEQQFAQSPAFDQQVQQQQTQPQAQTVQVGGLDLTQLANTMTQAVNTAQQQQQQQPQQQVQPQQQTVQQQPVQQVQQQPNQGTQSAPADDGALDDALAALMDDANF